MTIRVATNADIDRLAGLAETIRLRRQPGTSLTDSPRAQSLLVRRRLEQSSLPVLVADDTGVSGGELTLAAWCNDVLYRSEQWWVLDEMLVAPGGWPGRGIAVVAAMAGRARAVGVAGLAIGIEAGDHEASAALDAAGLSRATRWWRVALTELSSDADEPDAATHGGRAHRVAIDDLPSWFDPTPSSPTSTGPIIEVFVVPSGEGAPSCCAVVREAVALHQSISIIDPVAGPTRSRAELDALIDGAATSARRRGVPLIAAVATGDEELSSALAGRGSTPHSDWWTLLAG